MDKNELGEQLKKCKDFISKNEYKYRQMVEEEEEKKRNLLYIEYDKFYTDEMIDKLIKRIEFKYIGYGDVCSIGVDGKRPFGNSSIYGDIDKILGLSNNKYEYNFGDYEYQYIMKRIVEKLNKTF